jgi:hypothetical protein
MAVAPYGLQLLNDSFPSKTNKMTLQWKITAATTVSPLPINNSGAYAFFAAQTQDQIDDFLKTEDEFTAAQFDSTSMGADMFGVLIKMNGHSVSTDSAAGQAASVEAMVATCYSSTGGSTAVTRAVYSSATLTDSTAATEIAVGANGDIALKVSFGNTPDFDALTDGLITIDIFWTSI